MQGSYNFVSLNCGRASNQEEEAAQSFAFLAPLCTGEANSYKFSYSLLSSPALRITYVEGCHLRAGPNFIGEANNYVLVRPMVFYRGTLPIRNSALLGPYGRTMPRALWRH